MIYLFQKATLVKGEVVMHSGQATGVLQGRLMRGVQA
jgi:N-acyl-D-aspartate/D-glutamate deacylase